MIKLLLKQTPLYVLIKECLYIKSYWQWLKAGKPVPPPHIVKQMIIKEYSHEYNCPVFFETGTYKGDMVFSVKKNFDKIYSIELSEQLYKQARSRFRHDKHITILHGDSGEVLPAVLEEIKQPCLFWLDGHYSAGDTAQAGKKSPIEDEIAAILSHTIDNHVVLIDDAREFVGQAGYPKLDEFIRFVKKKRGDLSVSVENDIIRIYKV
ncbi:hypothetical protein KA005_11195 [bacterium]|nr:hypothetical protein [bacterium]